jgi:hypothetical protein
LFPKKRSFFTARRKSSFGKYDSNQGKMLPNCEVPTLKKLATFDSSSGAVEIN